MRLSPWSPLPSGGLLGLAASWSCLMFQDSSTWACCSSSWSSPALGPCSGPQPAAHPPSPGSQWGCIPPTLKLSNPAGKPGQGTAHPQSSFTAVQPLSSDQAGGSPLWGRKSNSLPSEFLTKTPGIKDRITREKPTPEYRYRPHAYMGGTQEK